MSIQCAVSIEEPTREQRKRGEQKCPASCGAAYRKYKRCFKRATKEHAGHYSLTEHLLCCETVLHSVLLSWQCYMRMLLRSIDYYHQQTRYVR